MAFLAAQAAAAVVLPADSENYWLHQVGDASRFGDNLVGNQSVRGMLRRSSLSVHWQTAIWLLAAAVILVVGYRRTVRAYRAGSEITAIAIVGSISRCLSPVTWSHHLVWLLLAVIALLADHAASGESFAVRCSCC